MLYFWILIGSLFKLKYQSSKITDKFYKNNFVSKIKKNKKSKHATNLRGVCLIHDNAGTHRCKLVKEFLDTESVVQLHNLLYSSDLSPCDFFSVYFTENQSLQTSKLAPLAVPLFSVCKVCPKKYS